MQGLASNTKSYRFAWRRTMQVVLGMLADVIETSVRVHFKKPRSSFQLSEPSRAIASMQSALMLKGACNCVNDCYCEMMWWTRSIFGGFCDWMSKTACSRDN